jgi:TonB family protein
MGKLAFKAGILGAVLAILLLSVSGTEAGEVWPDCAVMKDHPSVLAAVRGDSGNRLNLVAIITDSLVTLGAKGGFVPSLFYREFHRYTTRNGDLDTLIEYVPGGPMPRHPRSDRDLTIRERSGVYLHATDQKRRDVIHGMYTKGGEMLTCADQMPLRSVNVGDTVFALTNPRRRIVVTDLSDFESKPLLVYDQLKNILMQIKGRYSDASDINNIIITAEAGVHCDKILRVMDLARSAGFTSISFGILNGGTSGGGTSGGRSRASIQRVVMQNMAALRHAYNERLREIPGLSGRITVDFYIDEFGKVIYTQVVNSTMGDPKFENTVVTRVRSWEFDRIDKPGDVMKVTYPFVFSQ